MQAFIDKHVMTDPEWREAVDEADATREAAWVIARARKAAGLSQGKLAARSGTAQAVISRIERPRAASRPARRKSKRAT